MITIRRAVQEDKEALCRIQAEAIRITGRSHYSSDQTDAWGVGLTPGRYAEPIALGIVLVATNIEAAVVGWANLRPRSGELAALYVLPACQKRGIGRQLFQTIEQEARSLGIVSLSIQASLNAVCFYQRMGCRAEGQIVHRFGNGAEIPCVLMTKAMSAP